MIYTYWRIHIIEIWKDIKGYKGYYQVSNYGRIKSLDRYITRKDGVVQFIKGKLIAPAKNKDGYLSVKLCMNDIQKTTKIHQIVAKTFLDIPTDFDFKKYEVNHKDYNRENNCADNLEWCTHAENVTHSAKHGRYKVRNYIGKNNPNYGNHILSDFYKANPDIAREKLGRPAQQNGRATKIDLYDEKMNYIKTFDWIGGCAEYLKEQGFTKASINAIRSNITKSIKNNKKYANHYYKKIA